MKKVSNSIALITFYAICREEVHLLGHIDLKQEKFNMQRDVSEEHGFSQGPVFVSKTHVWIHIQCSHSLA